MEGQLKQSLTYPAEQYSQSFFRQLPTDSRFLQCTYQKFMPNSSIGLKTDSNHLYFDYILFFPVI